MDKVINIIGYGITNTQIVKLLNANNIKCRIFDDKFIESNKTDSKDSKNLCENIESNSQKSNIIESKVTESAIIESKNHDINEYLPLKNVTQNYENLSIISPGISPQTPSLRHFSNIISEYDFIFLLSEFLGRKIFSIWISGTNGKTTTTEMSALMANARSGGNIGTPLGSLFTQDFGWDFNAIWHESLQDSKQNFSLESLLKFINNRDRHDVFTQDFKAQVCFKNHSVYDAPSLDSIESNRKIWVLETSSFALHYTHYALPNAYILLPLSQDHISWHGGFKSYVSDKLKPIILANYSKNPKSYFSVIPKELTNLDFSNEILANFKGNLLLYENSSDLISFLKPDSALIALFKEPFLLDFTLSATALKFAKIPYNIDSIKNYKIGSYRMQEIMKNGILFINDSKGTNPHAVLAALKTYEKYNIYLILGGDSKGASLDMLYPFLKQNDVKVFCIGIDGEKINKECVNLGIKSIYCENLKAAMQGIFKQISYDFPNFIESNLQDSKNLSQKRPLVMLSPACASLDQYKSYKHRGDDFNALIEQIFTASKEKNGK